MAYTFGVLLDATWKSFKENISLYLLLAAVLSVLSVAFGLLAPASNDMGMFAVGAVDSALPSPLFWVAFVVLIIATILVSLGVISFIYFHETDSPKSFGESLKYSLSRFWDLFFTQLLMGIFLIGLFILLIIPGIIFSIFWVFVPLMVLFREKSGLAALKASKKLVDGQWWRVLGYFFMVGLIVGVISFAVSFVLGVGLFALVLTGGNMLIESLISFVINFVSNFVNFFSVVFFVGFFLALEDEKNTAKAQVTPAEKV